MECFTVPNSYGVTCTLRHMPEGWHASITGTHIDVRGYSATSCQEACLQADAELAAIPDSRFDQVVILEDEVRTLSIKAADLGSALVSKPKLALAWPGRGTLLLHSHSDNVTYICNVGDVVLKVSSIGARPRWMAIVSGQETVSETGRTPLEAMANVDAAITRMYKELKGYSDRYSGIMSKVAS